MITRIHCSFYFILMSFVLYAQTYPGKIGVNLGGISQGEFPTVEMTARFNIAGTPNAPTVDANGWPTENFLLTVFDHRPFNAWNSAPDDPLLFVPDVTGEYIISFNGQADISSWSDASLNLSRKVYDATSNMTVMTVNWPNTTAAGGWKHAYFALNFTNTRATSASALGTGVKNIRIVRPGFPAYVTQPFQLTFLNTLSQFSVFRFMDWTHTNNYGPASYDGTNFTTWNDRQKPDVYPWKNGVPWEYVIAMANYVGKDIWICIPHAATTDYVTQLARLIKNKLRTDINIYLEYSNEVWNGQFTQYNYNEQAVLNSPEDLNIRTSTGFNDRRRARRVAKRVIEIGKIFETELGVSLASRTRIRPVFAYQIGGYLEWYNDAMQWVNATYGPPRNFIYALASAPYFGHNPVIGETPQQVVSAMVNNSDNNAAALRTVTGMAQNWGLLHVQYEGGPDNGGGSTVNVANRIAANRIPEMGPAVVRNYRQNWFGPNAYGPYNATTIGFANYFVNTSSFSRYGCWGAVEDNRLIGNTQFDIKWRALCSLTGLCGVLPMIRVSSHTERQVVAQNTPLTIQAATTVTALSISRVEFFAGLDYLGFDATAPYSISYTPTVTGLIPITVKAIDTEGKFSFAPFVTLSVVSNFALSTNTLSISSLSGIYLVSVTGDASWSIAGVPSWLSLTPASASGARVVTVVSAVNTTSGIRTSVVTFSGSGKYEFLSISQAAGPSVLNISPATGYPSVPGTGQSLSVTIVSNVSWNTTGVPAWVTISPSSGSNNSILNLVVQDNGTITPRTAVITFTSGAMVRTFPVGQHGASASLQAQPSSLSAATNQAILVVTVSGNVTWIASKTATWLSISPLSGGSGTSLLTITVAGNTGAVRVGEVTVSGSGINRVVQINQSAFVPALTTSTLSIATSDNSSVNTLSITSNISWIASKTATWLSISPLSGGSGTSLLTITVSSNTGSARAGEVTVSGSGINRVVQINQSAFVPLLTVNPDTMYVTSLSGISALSITSNISWMINSNSSWVSLSTLTGFGNRNISLSWDENPISESRQALLTISGNGMSHVISIHQDKGHNLITTVSSLHIHFTQITLSGVSGIASYTISGFGNWSIMHNAPWLTPVSISGTGTNAGFFTFGENNTLNPRVASFTISGVDTVFSVQIIQKPLSINDNPTGMVLHNNKPVFYPNPMFDKLIVELAESAQVVIYDINGLPVKDFGVVTQGSHLLSVINLSKGIYILKIGMYSFIVLK